MATKVHDQGDEGEQEFAEIDRILAQAKMDRKSMRCRARNLSDIPENFAHVPSSPQLQHARPVSIDMSQPDFASRLRRPLDMPQPDRRWPDFMSTSTSRPPRPPRHHHSPKLHVPGLRAPVKWLRGYMGCLVAAHHRDGDHVHPRVASYGV